MKNLFTKFLCVFTLGIALNTNAQITVTVGTGTSVNINNSYPCVYGNFFWGAKHDILYTAAELTNLGLTEGEFVSMAFNVSSIPSATTLNNFSIGMKMTNATSITNTFSTGLTTVLPGTTYTPAIGWNTHNFTTPFFWDGVSNLIVQVCFNNGGFTNGNPGMTYTSTGFTSTSFFRQDNSSTVCSAVGGNVSTSRPNTQFTLNPSTTPPTTNFSATPTNTCQTSINFTDLSCCGVNGWKWYFGDGDSSSIKNPIHTYPGPGSYTVTLITTNNNGTDTLVKNNYINISSGGAAAASCNPAAATPFGGFGITNVTFNTINSTSGLATTGFDDFSCAWTTTVTEGSSYALSLSATGAAGSQNFRAWIDYNNDGVFSSPSEQVLTINSATSANASILIPVGAVLNTPLRMRVAADYDGSANLPTPCGTYDFGQAEDYSVIIEPNTNPPSADFSVDNTISCSGNVLFTDLSNNSPTSWDWDFGDLTTSALQNPSHSYQASGDYNVRLIATNGFGADTMIKNTYVHVLLGSQPIAASCTPTTTQHCCGYGISNVSFGSINKSSLSGIEGYKDFSCGNSTEITEGIDNLLLKIQTSAADSQDTRVWIDYNNNGSFGSNELVLTSNNHKNPSTIVNVPVGVAVLNTPLRMRVWSDFSGSTPGACNNPNRGQVEDYAVVVKPNVLPPDVHFGADITISCGGIVNFIDSTKNAIQSWAWDFGDSNTSNLQNPTHAYTAPGLYTVTLIVTNAFGADTLIKTDFINVVSTSPGPIAPFCSPATTGFCCGVGITNVTFGGINHSTGNAADGYSDYSCLKQTSILAGQAYPISITTSANIAENVRVWIDYNNDGQFNSSNEVVYSDFNSTMNHAGSITIPLTAVTNAPLRMRVVSDIGANLNSSCTNPVYGQVEDYGITITPNTNPPAIAFTANTTSTCNGYVTFSNTTTNVSTMTWDFGDNTTSTLVNPTHFYAASGVYTVSLAACNNFGCDTLVETNYITVTNGGPIPVNCAPATTGTCCQVGIYNFTLGMINNTTANATSGYNDYTCAQRDTNLQGGTSTPFSITTGPNLNENVRIYIDYNNNGNFNTPNELVFNGVSTQNLNGNILVPSTGVAFYNNLRMRVITDVNALTSACNNVSYGQAEDYTVYITNPNAVKGLAQNESFSIYPNPSHGKFQLNYSFEGKKQFQILVSDLTGRKVYSIADQSTSGYLRELDLTSLSKGIYFIRLTSEKNTLTQKITIE